MRQKGTVILGRPKLSRETESAWRVGRRILAESLTVALRFVNVRLPGSQQWMGNPVLLWHWKPAAPRSPRYVNLISPAVVEYLGDPAAYPAFLKKNAADY